VHYVIAPRILYRTDFLKRFIIKLLEFLFFGARFKSPKPFLNPRRYLTKYLFPRGMGHWLIFESDSSSQLVGDLISHLTKAKIITERADAEFHHAH